MSVILSRETCWNGLIRERSIWIAAASPRFKLLTSHASRNNEPNQIHGTTNTTSHE